MYRESAKEDPVRHTIEFTRDEVETILSDYVKNLVPDAVVADPGTHELRQSFRGGVDITKLDGTAMVYAVAWNEERP